MHQNQLYTFPFVFLAAAGLCMLALPNAVRADDTTATSTDDKSGYNLFNATPADKLRALSLDANDDVMDPTTVDAGHVQVQGDLVDYFRYTESRGPENLAEDYFTWSPRISLGVLNNVDVFVHPTFYATSYEYSGPYNRSHDSSDFENINIGAKVNLWGNDGGKTALSVAPYVDIPNANETVTGGGTISFAVRLSQQFNLKLSSNPYAFDTGHDSINFGMANSVSLHKSLCAKFDTYAYLNTEWQANDRGWIGYAGFGSGYLICPNLEVFLGIGFGLTSNAYDYNPRLGIGWRF